MKCSVSSCQHEARERGLCSGHAQRLRKTGKLSEEIPIGWKRMQRQCCVPGCDRRADTLTHCRLHDERIKRHGNPMLDVPVTGKTGKHASHWKGGITFNEGRKMVLVDGKYVFEYRLIVETALGRPLRQDEVVHHKNGDPHDNRLENLVVTTQPEHMKIHNATRPRQRNGRFGKEALCQH